jgi:hypothetical protein
MAPVHQDIERGRDPIYRVNQFIEMYRKYNAGIPCKIRLNELIDAINRVPTWSWVPLNDVGQSTRLEKGLLSWYKRNLLLAHG